MKDYAELSVEQINARVQEIVTEFTALDLNQDSSDEDVTKGEALAEEIVALRAELTARAQVAEERSGRLALLNDVFAQDEKPADGGDEAPDEPVEEPVEEPQAEPPHTEEPTPPRQEVAQVPVAASAKTSPARRAAAHAPEVKMPKFSSVAAITAAADVPNYAAGQKFDSLTQASEALVSRARAMPSRYMANTRLRYGALKFDFKEKFGDDLVQDRTVDDYGLIQRAGNERRLPEGSLALTADAWCAPSQSVYDLCSYEVADGLLSIPEFAVTRGGINYTPGPDLSDIYADADYSFHVDNTGVITDGAGATVTEKPCGVITCPPFSEVRLEVDGVCISVDILANVGFPELTRRHIELALIAHARRINAANIKAMEVAAGTATTVDDNGTFAFNLDYFEWHAEVMKSKYSLGINGSIEVVLPTWVKPLIRAEFARRNGVELQAMTDAEINSWFSVRSLSPQFVRDWQPIPGSGGTIAIPALATALFYPAGTWTRGTQAVINLDAVYDSTLLAQNKYLGLFTEEASLLVQRCLGTSAVKIPTCVGGLTGAQIAACLDAAYVPTP